VPPHTKKTYTSQQYNDKLSGSQPPSLAEVVWLGDSLQVLRGFPKPVQGDLGYALERVQRGQTPPDSKPMGTVGTGVYELRDQDARAWYRVFYLKKIQDVIYVLHCFEKKTAQTEKKDIDVARQRLKHLLEQQRQESARQPAEKRQAGKPQDKGQRSQ
jgi:phage-related protein